MPLNITIFKKSTISPILWDGGESYPFFIYPENTDYRNKDFDFRISSASIEKIPSVFTQFQGYNRFLFMLDNELKIVRNNREEHYSKEDLFEFDSSDKIISYSRGNDFNLMIKKSFKKVTVKKVSDYLKCSEQFLFLFSIEPATVKLNEKPYEVNRHDCIVVLNQEATQINIQIQHPFIFGCWS